MNRLTVATLIICLWCSLPSAAEEPLASVASVLHEGTVTFTVRHPAAVSTRVRVYDLASDALLFDSGPRRGTSVTWPVGRDLEGAWRYLVVAWDDLGEVVTSQTATSAGLDQISSLPFDTVPGGWTAKAGSSAITLDGGVDFGSPSYLYSRGLADGGSLYLKEEDGREFATLEPDFSGSGGYLEVQGTAGSSDSFAVQGNVAGEMTMGISSSNGIIYFNGNAAGDDSITLTDGSVSAVETAAEAGVAATSFGAINLIAIPSSLGSIASVTLVAPADGYVLASASGYLTISHTNGLTSAMKFGLSTAEDSAPSNQDLDLLVPPEAPTAGYKQPISHSAVFPVSAGATTFYVVAQTLAGSFDIADGQLTALFVPTAYGNVQTLTKSRTTGDESPGPGRTYSEADVQAERTAAIAANQARLEAELSDLRARIEALRSLDDNVR